MGDVGRWGGAGCYALLSSRCQVIHVPKHTAGSSSSNGCGIRPESVKAYGRSLMDRELLGRQELLVIGGQSGGRC